MLNRTSFAACGTVLLIGVAISSSRIHAAQATSCDLSEISGARALHEVLSRRAVEIMRLAAAPAWKQGKRLEAMVSPTARFSLGAGDVGRPLGTGTEGARSLAKTVRADRFRFDEWNYMDGPVQPCSFQTVTVDFIDSVGNQRSEVKFKFLAGRVADAEGWQRSFQAGALVRPSQKR